MLLTARNALNLLLELEAERDVKASEIATFQAKLAAVVRAPDKDGLADDVWLTLLLFFGFMAGADVRHLVEVL